MTSEYRNIPRCHEYGPPPENIDSCNILSRQLICALENFPEYILQYVFILEEDVGFRLAVIHYGQVKINEYFKTLQAAKDKFARIYQGKFWKKDSVPEWTDFYEPNDDWLIDKLLILKNDIESRMIAKSRGNLGICSIRIRKKAKLIAQQKKRQGGIKKRKKTGASREESRTV
jgi:hypothetical protein